MPDDEVRSESHPRSAPGIIRIPGGCAAQGGHGAVDSEPVLAAARTDGWPSPAAGPGVKVGAGDAGQVPRDRGPARNLGRELPVPSAPGGAYQKGRRATVATVARMVRPRRKSPRERDRTCRGRPPDTTPRPQVAAPGRASPRLGSGPDPPPEGDVGRGQQGRRLTSCRPAVPAADRCLRRRPPPGDRPLGRLTPAAGRASRPGDHRPAPRPPRRRPE